MADKFQNKYRIPSARHPNWDYRWNAAYFITICTKNREPYFGKISGGKMQLSNIGVIADLLWHTIKNHSKHVEMGEFVIMPNHIHGILIINNPSILFKNENENDDGNNILFEKDSIEIVDMDGDADGEETRHALSLSESISESESQFKKSIGQKRLQNPGKNSISSIIGGYKSAVTKNANRLKYKFSWQTRFHDHIIRDDRSFQNISNYIINNPKNWDEDKFNAQTN